MYYQCMSMYLWRTYIQFCKHHRRWCLHIAFRTFGNFVTASKAVGYKIDLHIWSIEPRTHPQSWPHTLSISMAMFFRSFLPTLGWIQVYHNGLNFQKYNMRNKPFLRKLHIINVWIKSWCTWWPRSFVRLFTCIFYLSFAVYSVRESDDNTYSFSK